MLGVSVATINRWAISGELEQAQQLPNGSRLFRRGVVRERAAQLAEEAEARAADLRAASA